MQRPIERVLYLDASAILKIVLDEPEAAPLSGVVAGWRLATSELSIAEVPRAVWGSARNRRSSRRGQLIASGERLLGGFEKVPLNRGILLQAGSFREQFLRTLDAIHLASALRIGDAVAAFVTYDARQADAARRAGFEVLAPS